MQLKLVLACLFVTALLCARMPLDEQEWHHRADAVLFPALVSKMNDWSMQHGSPTEKGHLDKLDAQDKKRLEIVRQAYKEWDDAMKRAGY